MAPVSDKSFKGAAGLDPDDAVSFCERCILGKMTVKPFEPVGEMRVTQRLYRQWEK